MPAVTNGAELVKRLAAAGTGGAKLDLARGCLLAVMAKDGRVATSEQVVEALEAGGASELTLAKARAIAATGEWAGPTGPATLTVEERLLAEAARKKDEPAAKK